MAKAEIETTVFMKKEIETDNGTYIENEDIEDESYQEDEIPEDEPIREIVIGGKLSIQCDIEGIHYETEIEIDSDLDDESVEQIKQVVIAGILKEHKRMRTEQIADAETDTQ